MAGKLLPCNAGRGGPTIWSPATAASSPAAAGLLGRRTTLMVRGKTLRRAARRHHRPPRGMGDDPSPRDGSGIPNRILTRRISTRARCHGSLIEAGKPT